MKAPKCKEYNAISMEFVWTIANDKCMKKTLYYVLLRVWIYNNSLKNYVMIVAEITGKKEVDEPRACTLSLLTLLMVNSHMF